MKKLLLLMLGAVFALSSCQRDDLSSGSGRDVAVRLVPMLPTPMTRTSDQGGIDNVDWTSVSLRYTLEIYQNGTLVPVTVGDVSSNQHVLYKESSADARAAAFENIRLLSGRDYQFVVWADFVNKDKTELHYTTAQGLKTVSVLDGTGRVGNDDSRDAYFATQSLTVTDNSTLDLSLSRPLGKLRVITTDIAVAKAITTVDANTTAKVTYSTAIPVEFNAFTGIANQSTASVPASYTAKISELTDQTATLAFDYLFTDPTDALSPIQTAVNFKVECLGVAYDFSSSSVKIERNKLTTVKGNILTKGTSISISIDDAFDGTLTTDIADVVPTIDAVQAKLDKAAQEEGLPVIVKVTESVETNTLTIPADLKVENTPKLSFDFSAGISSDNTLTIAEAQPDDASTHYVGDVYISVPSSDAANLVVNMPSATVYVNGTISTLNASVSPNTLVINKDAEIGTLTITKGNVDNYGTIGDIVVAVGANNTTTINNYGAFTGNITTDSGSYVMTATVSSAEELRSALVNPVLKGVILKADVKWESSNPTLGNSDNQDAFKIGINDVDDYYAARPMDGFVLDGNGHTISGVAYNNVFAVYAHNVTIKNLTIEQTPTQAATKANGGLSIYRSKNVMLQNVTIRNCGKAGLCVNAATATATALTTSGNVWGGIDITKGGAPSGGEKPVFTFDDTCTLNEPIQLYVSKDRTFEDYTVNAPRSWDNGYIFVDGKAIYIYSSKPIENKVTVANGLNVVAVDSSISTSGSLINVDNTIFTTGTNAFATVAEAFSKVATNGVVRLAAGTYDYPNTAALTIPQGLTLEGVGAETVIVGQVKPLTNSTLRNIKLYQPKITWDANQGLAYAPVYMVSSAVSGVTIDNVDFDTANTGTSSKNGATAIYVSVNSVIKNCSFTNYWKSIFVGSGTATLTVTGNEFNNTNPISCVLSNATITDNIFRRNKLLIFDVQLNDMSGATADDLVISGGRVVSASESFKTAVNAFRANNKWEGSDAASKPLRIRTTDGTVNITADM